MKTLRYFILMLALLPFYQAKAQTGNIALNPILQAYYGVEKALVNDNSKMANTQAGQLTNIIKGVNPANFDAEQKKAWTNYNIKLSYNSRYISESKNIEEQRNYFASLSDALYSLLKTFKTHPTIYRQYCPMKKQYWLNPTTTIQNPYYGKEMLDCGKVTETITGSPSVVLIK